MSVNRRGFLKGVLGGAAAIAVGSMIPTRTVQAMPITKIQDPDIPKRWANGARSYKKTRLFGQGVQGNSILSGEEESLCL
jgi:hypothetical protein